MPYVEVKLNKQISFLSHLRIKRQEIQKITQNLHKFSSVLGRLQLHIFKICYNSVRQRKLAYAYAIWLPHMWWSHGCHHLLSVQKSALLLMSRTCTKTTSPGLQILTCRPPLDHQIECQAELSQVTRLLFSKHSHLDYFYTQKVSKYTLRP